jgi:hypothetical protein
MVWTVTLKLFINGNNQIDGHTLLNTRKLPVYSTCRLCQQTRTLNLLVVVQGQCTMGCAADEWDGGQVFSALKLEPLARGVNPNRKS